MTDTIALRYLGGAYIHGVPARDLTAAEAQQYQAIIQEQERIIGARLYEPVKPAKATKPAGEGE